MKFPRFPTLILAALLAACGGGGGGGGGQDVGLVRMAPALSFPSETIQAGDVALVKAFPGLQFNAPLAIKTAPGDTTHLYVAQQGGLLQTFDGSDPAVTAATVVLDLTDRTRANGEQGLLGIAFDPDYASNGFLYVNYSANANPNLDAGDSVISRFVVDRATRVANRASEVQLLRFADRFSNHNGGDLAFGPDGMLYISSGDGGSGNDPDQNAQNLNDLRGKILRIFPRGTAAQVVPANNPFVDVAGTRAEIWAYGLRNPFRMSFDGSRLWTGDVGQGAFEEIDLIVRGGNYGWRKFEGTRLNFPSDQEITPAPIAPIFQYGRDQGVSITGGRVYRGTMIPALVGRYIYGDFGSGRIWALSESGGAFTDNVELTSDVKAPNPSSFDVDLAGELLITCYDGYVYRLVPNSPSPGGGGTFPQRLSETGLFSNLATLQPAPGVVPYIPNAPFWSDGTRKQRWIAVPGTTSPIAFSSTGNWAFPVGTVTVKHFEITLAAPAGAVKRLETRVFINTRDDGWQGYTYRWNDAGTDAVLLPGAETVELQVADGSGGTRNQTYEFPSRAQCLECHTSVTGRVLGVRTNQLNGGASGNQLDALNNAGYFASNIGAASSHPALPDPFGSAPLPARARAYLESNCSQCHQPGGPTPVNMDLRAATPIGSTNMVGVAGVGEPVGGATTRIVVGSKATSLVWTRMNTDVEAERMPPLSTHVIDAQGRDLIGAWIDAGAN